jgi:hypothetical protein
VGVTASLAASNGENVKDDAEASMISFVDSFLVLNMPTPTHDDC